MFSAGWTSHGFCRIWIHVGLSSGLSQWYDDPLTFVPICDHQWDWHYLLGLWLTCRVTVVSSVARIIRWMCESTTCRKVIAYYSRVWSNRRGKVANPARGQLNRENEYFPVLVCAWELCTTAVSFLYGEYVIRFLSGWWCLLVRRAKPLEDCSVTWLSSPMVWPTTSKRCLLVRRAKPFDFSVTWLSSPMAWPTTYKR